MRPINPDHRGRSKKKFGVLFERRKSKGGKKAVRKKTEEGGGAYINENL